MKKQPTSAVTTDVLGLAPQVAEIAARLSEQEKRQDAVLPLTREIVRECSVAIRHLHSGSLAEAQNVLSQVREKVDNLKGIAGTDLQHTADIAYQEFVEATALLSIAARKSVPTYSELGLPPITYLNGLCDCGGELRRQIQIAIKDGDKTTAEYYFAALDSLYEQLMALKYSSSLVGSLKRKQDVLRGQLEAARGEMLRLA
jgi:translin